MKQRLALAATMLGDFIAAQLVVSGGLALAGTDWAAATRPLVTWVQWSALGGFVLAFLGYGSSALFVSMSIRNSGPVTAVWFFYVAILERLLGSALVAISDRLEPVVQFLP